MLPELHLDDEMYQEIFEQARNKIALYYPQWTDYNEHDPGITFLELFSWLKEAQQFYMDHMDKPMKLKFLQLLGAECRNNCPAHGWLVLESCTRGKILQGTPFYSEKLCLTLQKTVWNSGTIIKSMTAANGFTCHVQEMKSNKFVFFPFGKVPEKDDIWEITFNKSISGIRQLTLYVYVFEEYPVCRNSFSSSFIRLAEWQAEVNVNNKWIPCEILSDETLSLMVSGQICLRLPSANEIKAVRFRLQNQIAYDVPPLITGIRLNVFSVKQIEQISVYDTADQKEAGIFQFPLSYPSVHWKTKYLAYDGTGYLVVEPDNIKQTDDNYIVKINEKYPITKLLAVHAIWERKNILHPGKGNGFPYQEFDLNCIDMHYDSFSLLIYDSYDNHWHFWKKRKNLLESTHTDRVYKLDEKNGKLQFGDGIHGRMPDGEIWIISAAFTYAEKGNLKNGKISYSPISENMWKNGFYLDLTGGASAETPLECRNRKKNDNNLPSRAVTGDDYEKLVLAAPGLMIRSCHVSSGDPEQNTVHIAVEPYTENKKAEFNPVYLKVLKQFLEPHRLIGTKIEIDFPQYADIHLYASLYVYSRSNDCENSIRRKLEKLFQTDYHVFGKPVLYSEVYAAIDLMPEVKQIQTFVMQCRNDCVKINRNGDLFLPKNGLPYLSQLELKLITST